MNNLVIVGAGGCGREVAWLVEEMNKKSSEWNLLGFIDEDPLKVGEELNGYKVLGGLNYLKGKSDVYYVCAIGISMVRKAVIKKCEKLSVNCATLIHPNVDISSTSSVGKGSIICSGSIITVNCTLGEHVIVNTNCTLGHDSIMKDFVTIHPSASVSGNCILESCVQIGTGARIIQGKTIGENSIIGAGAVVVKDIEANKTAVGVPAKVIK